MDLSAYAVEPGATLRTDPRIQNFVAPNAVQAALNDLFGKIESDACLASL